jgi:hypothetical protein
VRPRSASAGASPAPQRPTVQAPPALFANAERLFDLADSLKGPIAQQRQAEKLRKRLTWATGLVSGIAISIGVGVATGGIGVIAGLFVGPTLAAGARFLATKFLVAPRRVPQDDRAAFTHALQAVLAEAKAHPALLEELRRNDRFGAVREVNQDIGEGRIFDDLREMRAADGVYDTRTVESKDDAYYPQAQTRRRTDDEEYAEAHGRPYRG